MSSETMSETQESVSPETQPTEDTASDLDTLLAEYETPKEESTQSTQTEQPAQPTISPDKLAEFEAFMARQNQKDLKVGLNESSKMVKAAAGDVAQNIPDRIFEDMLHGESFRNPKIVDIFMDRENNPEKWANVVKALGQKFAKEYQPVDSAATQSWDTVTSAVRSSATSKPTEEPSVDAKTLRRMSPQEFEEHKRKHGFARR